MRKRTQTDVERLIKLGTGKECSVIYWYNINTMSNTIAVKFNDVHIDIIETARMQVCDDDTFLNLIRPALNELFGE